jgi:transposase
MAAIGVDTHKFSLAACAVDERGAVVAEASFVNDPAGHDEFARWAAAAMPRAVVGIEGSATYGAALVHSLGPTWSVREVPPHLTRRERIRTRRPGKSDPGDALAIARVTLREHELPPPRRAGASRDLQLLVEARDDLVGEATRMRNRLHADLLVLLPGDRTVAGRLVGPRRLALVAARLRRRPELQAELARSRLAALRRLDAEIGALEARIAARVTGHPLLAIPGVGPLVAAKLLGEIGDVRRLRSADGFAALAGVAPIPASSGQRQRMRLNRGGNRQLNRALFTIAMVQLRHYPPAQAFAARKRAEGKSGREAIRCLKRHLARAVFHALRRGVTEATAAA